MTKPNNTQEALRAWAWTIVLNAMLSNGIDTEESISGQIGLTEEELHAFLYRETGCKLLFLDKIDTFIMDTIHDDRAISRIPLTADEWLEITQLLAPTKIT